MELSRLNLPSFTEWVAMLKRRYFHTTSLRVECNVCIRSFDRFYHVIHPNTMQHTTTYSCTLKLQHTVTPATHCNTSLTATRTATHYNTRPQTATHCNTLILYALLASLMQRIQQNAPHWSTQKHTAAHSFSLHPYRTVFLVSATNTLQHTATRWNPMQHTAARLFPFPRSLPIGPGSFGTHCNTLQHISKHCRIRVLGLGVGV